MLYHAHSLAFFVIFLLLLFIENIFIFFPVIMILCYYRDAIFFDDYSSFIPFFKFYFIYFFIQQVISHQFDKHQCIQVIPSLPIHHTTTPTPTTFPPWCPYVCSLHLCLSFCPANRFICTTFLGSTYMR